MSEVTDRVVIADIVRQRIYQQRVRQGMNQAQLAQRMRALGTNLTYDRISKIETGVRSVKAEELVLFSVVLDVPLALLVCPLDIQPL